MRVQQELHATNSAIFKKSIYELTGIKPQEIINKKKKIEAAQKKLEAKNQPSSMKRVTCRYFEPASILRPFEFSSKLAVSLVLALILGSPNR